MAMTKREESQALEANKDIVLSIARKYSSYGVDFDDLVQEGYLGFLQGIRKWSPDGGASLRTYAGQWAATYIRRAIGTDSKGKLTPEERTTSLDEACVGEDGGEGRSLHEVLPSSTFENPEEAAERNERIRTVRDAMESLSPREAAIVSGGLSGNSNAAIGRTLGISREGVRQIKCDAVDLLARRVSRAS